jgi:peptidyl-prolyl cis-trans isomerase B (cyclophilin B)
MISLGLAVLLALQSAPVKLTLEAPGKTLRPGGKMILRFTIETGGDTETKLDEPDNYLEGLEIVDGEGKVVKATGKTKGITKRSPSVEPGGFIGRAVDISPVFAVPEDREGEYRFRWSFGDAVSNEIRILVMRDWIATIETNHGTLVIEFFPQVAPAHVRNFLKLARGGFYEGSIFHRIIPGFMLQGGSPLDPKNEVKTPLRAEFSDLKHVFGTLSMARTTDPNSATTQFFICCAAVPHLDKNYSIFGQLISGHEVVKEIEKVKSDHNPCKECGKVPARTGANVCCGAHHQDKPEQDVVIKKITVTERNR